ncbi:hypothetical protein Bca52824_011482 [Brassica carinata]|uniref:Uncharacterized protein n=1 Tax=Brassica carinata TaxID=52824 RepID=A0A8X7WDK1_BRACI|nr:hypothetical protein Bca52824_011482 [Brassica carinata]
MIENQTLKSPETGSLNQERFNQTSQRSVQSRFSRPAVPEPNQGIFSSFKRLLGEGETQALGKIKSSRTPPARPPREPMRDPPAPITGDSNNHSRERISVLERIESPSSLPNGDNSSNSRERVSALERIELPTTNNHRGSGLSSLLMERLQDVEVNYAGDDPQNHLKAGGSGSKTKLPGHHPRESKWRRESSGCSQTWICLRLKEEKAVLKPKPAAKPIAKSVGQCKQ